MCNQFTKHAHKLMPKELPQRSLENFCADFLY
jgi:hypothetical protein